MNKEFLMRIRAALTKELAVLTSDPGRASTAEQDATHAVADPLDQAQAQTEQSLSLRFSDRKHRYLLKLKEALSRIDLGVFGKCEECEGDIPVKRLLARPTAIYCVACKNELESQERMRMGPRIPAFAPG